MTENTSLDGIHGFLYSLYLQGKNETEAHEQLLKTLGEDSFDLNLVADFYSRIQIGEYKFGMNSLKEQIDLINEERQEEIDPRLVLENLPLLVKKDIVQNLDITSRVMLQKVSHHLREVVEETGFRIDKLTIDINIDDLTVCDNQLNIDLDYEKVRVGCVITKGSETSLLKTGNYLDIVQEDLKEIFGLSKLTITELRIQENPDILRHQRRSQYLDVIQILQNVLSSLEQKLKVTKLYMDIENVDELKSILSYLDPKTIKSIEICESDRQYALNRIDEISELEQWKNAKRFVSRLSINDSNFVEHFSHFEYAVFRLSNSATVGDVIKLKDALLLLPSLILFEVDLFEFNGSPDDDVNNAFAPIAIKDRFRKSWYNFKYSNSEELLSVRSEYGITRFRGPEYITWIRQGRP